MKALIVHGWGADSSSNWFPWLKRKLDTLGIPAFCPDLPNSHLPKKDEWVAALRSQARWDGEIVLIGHSLGCPAILRLLESLGKAEAARVAILVSGFAHDIGIPEISNFTEGGFDFRKIRSSCKEFFVINSDNDPYVPIKEGEFLAKSLGTTLILERGAGHINLGDGHFEYWRVLEIVRKLAYD